MAAITNFLIALISLLSILHTESIQRISTIFITNDIKRIEDQQKSENIMINDDCYFDANEQSFDSVTNSAYATIAEYVDEVYTIVGLDQYNSDYELWSSNGNPGESIYPRPFLRTLKEITFSVPGFSSDVPQTEVLFDDTIDITTNELITETESISSLSSALPDSSRSNYLIKSASSGFIYGNNPEGTDSLAFGGLLRK